MKHPPDIFVSYAHGDSAAVTPVIRAMAEKGLKVWSAEDSVEPGESWEDALEGAMDNANGYVIFLSPDYLRTRWTNFEMGAAAAKAAAAPQRRLIPVLLPGTTWGEVPFLIRDRRGIDATKMSADDVAGALTSALT